MVVDCNEITSHQKVHQSTTKIKKPRERRDNVTNPMVFVKVDWDVYYGSAIAYDYKIPRRSTLLVLRGDQELGRNVADASKASIKSLMDLGLTGS